MIIVKDMKILEQNSEYFGTSTAQLMENAGKGIADYVNQHFPHKKVIVVAGHGNNGGDGFVAARYLGCNVYFAGNKDKFSLLALKNFKKLNKKQFAADFKDADIIIDAIFGCGFKGDAREPYAALIKQINVLKKQKKIPIISVDIPSGLDADTTEIPPIVSMVDKYRALCSRTTQRDSIGTSFMPSDLRLVVLDTGKGKIYVDADIVLTMHDTKPGLKQFKVNIIDIGIPPKAITCVGPGDVKAVIPERKLTSHKGDFGRVLVLAGSLDYRGAAVLVCQALVTLRSGVDLITVAAPEKTALLINSFIPDIITKKLKGDYFNKEHLKEIVPLFEKTDAVVIGPGLGKQSDEFVKEIIKKTTYMNKKMVIDADALKAININNVKNAILTPHQKEFELLTGQRIFQVIDLNQRIKIVLKHAKNNVILLKGSPDIIAYQGKYKLNYTGNPGMTVGGTGDVLAGLCAGFLAQSGDLFESACAASFVNGLAGDRLKKELGYGFIASDMSKEIARIIKKLTQ